MDQPLGPTDLGWVFKIRAKNKEGLTNFVILNKLFKKIENFGR